MKEESKEQSVAVQIHLRQSEYLEKSREAAKKMEKSGKNYDVFQAVKNEYTARSLELSWVLSILPEPAPVSTNTGLKELKKTADEILRKNIPTITFDKLIGTPVNEVIKAMEEYAEQFKGKGSLPSVSEGEDKPKEMICPNCKEYHTEMNCEGYCSASCLQGY